MRQAIALGAIIGTLAMGIAGCGGGNAKAHRAAVDYCTFGDTNNGGNGDRASCECAVTNLEKQGYSDQKILSESKDNAAMLSDKKLITVSLLCAGR